MVGSSDWERCPLASRLPTALWHIAGKSVLERLLISLAKEGIDQVVICSNGDTSLLVKSVPFDDRMKIKLLDEQLPVGTAGCIRDAAINERDSLLLVLPASIASPPKIDTLIKAHYKGKSELTVMFNPSSNQDPLGGESAGIYICETNILKYIPKEGYFDIKEGLIPEMLRAGKNIYAAALPHNIGNFRNWQEYLSAIDDYLRAMPKFDSGLKLLKSNDSQILWTANNVKIDPSARFYGTVVIMKDAEVLKNAVVFGPTILGRNVLVDEGSLVANSVLWDDARVGPNCEIQQCVVDYQTVVPGNTVIERKAIPFKTKGMLKGMIDSGLKATGDNASKLRQTLKLKYDQLNKKLPYWLKSHERNIIPSFVAGLVVITFLWSYWPTILDLWDVWQRSDEYSSGLLVPFLAIYILWSRRRNIDKFHMRPSVWGIFAFLVAQGLRWFGLFFMYGSAERLSLVLSVAALVLLLFGWQFFRKLSTLLLFLCLMLPWPNRVQAALALPLQHWATSSAVFCLEMIGYEIIREGNVIHIGQASIAVAEACNGLRMITAFFVISSLVVLLVKREWWEKLLVLASSLPIALFCNTVRLTITAIAFTMLSGEYWEKIFHDFGGYAMMPLALGLVVLEFWLLTKLTTAPPAKQVVLASK